MPLHTRIERDGELVKCGWGHFHVAAMALAAALDDEGCRLHAPALEDGFGEQDPILISPATSFALADYTALGATPLNEGSYTLRKDYTFKDIMDDEIFPLKRGDVLTAVRN